VYASTAGEEYSFVKKWGTQGDAVNQFEEPTGIVLLPVMVTVWPLSLLTFLDLFTISQHIFNT
jgi:hypothetical protein